MRRAAACLLFAASSAGSAFAQDVAYEKRTALDFEDDTIEGDVPEPSASFVAPLPRAFADRIPKDAAAVDAAIAAQREAKSCADRHLLAELLTARATLAFFAAEEEKSEAERARWKQLTRESRELYTAIASSCATYPRIDLVTIQLVRLELDDDSTSALEHARALVRASPTSPHAPEAWFQIGELLRAKSDPRAALDAYGKVPEASDLYPIATYYRGWCNLDLGQPDRALDAFRTAATFPGLHAEALRDFVRIYAGQGDAARAEAALAEVAKPEELVSALKSLLVHYRDGGAHRAVLVLGEVLLQKKLAPDDVAMIRARMLDAAIRIDAAATITHARALVDALRAAPNSEEVTRAEEMIRTLVITLHRRSKVTRDPSTSEVTAELYAIYLAAFPKSEQALAMHFYFGELLYAREKFTQAAAEYDAAIAIAPRAGRDQELVRSAIDAAVHALDAASRDDPRHKKALLAACERYLAQSDGSKPNEAAVRYRAARIYEEDGRLDEALAAWKMIVASRAPNESCPAAFRALDVQNRSARHAEMTADLEVYLADDRLPCGKTEVMELARMFGKVGSREKRLRELATQVYRADAPDRACAIARVALDLSYARRDVAGLKEAAIAFGESKMACGIDDAQFIAEREVVVELLAINESLKGAADRGAFERAAAAYRAIADKLAAKLERMKIDPARSDYLQLVRFNAAAAHALAGKRDQAAALWRSLVETSRGMAGARAGPAAVLLGEELLAAGELARAERLFEAVLEASPNELAARSGLAEARSRTGRAGTRSALAAIAPAAQKANPERTLPKAIAPVKLEAAAPVIMGSLDKESIRSTIRQSTNQIRACYESELQRNRSLEGRVVVFFEISDGRVVTALIRQSSVRSPPLEKCIVDRIRGWQFPRPKGGGIVDVTYPFVLKSSS